MSEPTFTLTNEPDPFDAADFFGLEGQDDLDDSPAAAIMRGRDEPENVAELRALVDWLGPIRVVAWRRRDPKPLLARLAEYVNDEWWDEMEHDAAAEQSGKDHARSEAKVRELLEQFAAFMGQPTWCDEVASRTFGTEEMFDLLLVHYAGDLDEESET
jgi:hypothetical protein